MRSPRTSMGAVILTDRLWVHEQTIQRFEWGWLWPLQHRSHSFMKEDEHDVPGCRQDDIWLLTRTESGEKILTVCARVSHTVLRTVRGTCLWPVCIFEASSLFAHVLWSIGPIHSVLGHTCRLGRCLLLLDGLNCPLEMKVPPLVRR